MKLRRAALVALLAISAWMLPLAAAEAASAPTVSSPAVGDTVTQGARLEVMVPFDLLDPRPNQVQVRLVDTDRAPVSGSGPVSLSCASKCGDLDLVGGTSTWAGKSFDPASLAPFGNQVSCNGAYGIQVSTDGSSWGSGAGFIVSLPPAAPTDVAADASPAGTVVSWTAPPQPDITGYGVERRAPDGDWQPVADAEAGTTSLTDGDAGPGDREYRVTAFRGDGLSDGPAPACSDAGRDLQAASAAATVSVPAPTPSADPSASPGATPTPTPSPIGPATDAGGAAGGGAAGAGQGDEDPSGGSASAPDASTPSADSGDTQTDAPAPTTDDSEHFLGDDQGFSEELDFGGLGGMQATEDAKQAAGSVELPSAVQGVLGEQLALRRLLTPIAGGLIMLAVALHLRRWMRTLPE